MISLDLANAADGGAHDFEALRKKFLARGQGWLDCLDDSTDDFRSFAQKFSQKFDEVVVLGIGGSALGARMLADFFGTSKLQVLDTIDPVEVAKFPRSPNTLFVVISKSGGTLETMALRDHFLSKMPTDRFVVVTERDSNLWQWADVQQVPAFEMPTDVGGRYSVLTSVGMLPAAAAGLPIDELLVGAREMRDDFLNETTPRAAQLAAAIFDANRATLVHLPYCSSLRTFGQWWVQLVAESLGKNGCGYTPVCAVGPTDQHSLLQLLAEGPDQFATIFVRDASIASERLGKIVNIELVATSQSLAELGRPNLTIEISDRSARTLGQLIVLWECAVALLGEMLAVDAFDQPGVERSKSITREKLEALE